MSNENETSTDLVPMTAAELAALVPASLDALAPVHTESAAPEKRYVAVPYVAFRGKKSEKNTDALDAAGIKVDKATGNGVFYLMDIEPVDVRAPGKNSIGLHLIQYARLYTLTDNTGKIIESANVNTNEMFADGFREHLFALVAVALGGGQFKAATLQLQSAQCNALRQTLALIGEPGRPGVAMKPEEWGKRSAAHAKTADPNVKVPGFRFRTEIWSVLTAPKGDGEKFNEGHGAVQPTSETEFAALNKWAVEAWPSIQVAAAKYNKMVAEARKKIPAGV